MNSRRNGRAEQKWKWPPEAVSQNCGQIKEKLHPPDKRKKYFWNMDA